MRWLETGGKRFQIGDLDTLVYEAKVEPEPEPEPALSNVWRLELLDGSTVDVASAFVEDGQRFQPGGPAKFYLSDLLTIERVAPSTNGRT